MVIAWLEELGRAAWLRQDRQLSQRRERITLAGKRDLMQDMLELMSQHVIRACARITSSRKPEQAVILRLKRGQPVARTGGNRTKGARP